MKKMALSAALMLILAVSPGCTTIYKAAVEERSLSAQAADADIKGKVLAALAADGKVKALDISPECYEGSVYLVGEYVDPAEKIRAIRLAENVSGVKKVITYILPRKNDDLCGTVENLRITADVRTRLIKDMDIHSTNVEIKTVQCNVVLLGIVGSRDEADRAIAHAKSVEGVRTVVSYIAPVK